jgi:hypothetical protein
MHAILSLAIAAIKNPVNAIIGGSSGERVR